MPETELPVVGFHPYLWGDPAHHGGLSPAILAALSALGVTAPARPAAEPASVPLPPVALPDSARAALESLVGAEHVDSGHDARLAHTRGWSTPDLLRLRGGDAADAPDAVVFPGSHDEVVAVLRVCAEHRIAVVPYSGGTSVVGGLAPARAGFAGVVTLDLRRLDALVEVDPVSRTAVLQAGLRGPEAERLLREHGLTLGHFPQSYEGASIGGYAAARSAGQSSAGYGRFDEMVVGLVLATPRGTVELGTAPKSAAGPDLRQLVLGSEGVLGVITSVRVRVRPVPAERVFEGWRFPSFEAGADALRQLAQDGPLPTVLRLSDELETAINLADPAAAGFGDGPGGCLAITGYEGGAAEVAARRAAATEALLAAGGTALGPGPGESWREGRFRAPYLRDPILAAGGLVETLETATFWSGLHRLRAAVSEALTTELTGRGTPPVVLCHISHVYETGASLYFTVVCAQAADPLAQWAAAKTAANRAIRSCGAAITHHHGVGTDHRAAYAEEIGPLAVAALRAVKQALDPAGILNPGVLLPPPGG
ncbi:FAD-binding oxidoreductase [Sphaerimonospora thailandensis]|uniref:Alkyldihydroxyacetonephosphate synthase n=1 Tax=Sphaerimonospora thailandensis TaxID=795644 RepID=A0A8J3RC18_9ACTN|nr:FAD-binding oxidoreductase [Sphaerimonospora thailandensis]GIH69778.1 alkyldihydroxyacetonephosphate synthase [Sphaerimonospora thailandensis]